MSFGGFWGFRSLGALRHSEGSHLQAFCGLEFWGSVGIVLLR